MDSGIYLGIFFIVIGLAGVLVVWQTMTRGRWGLGALKANCPRCGTALPVMRKPASTDEAIWGGWTCPNCGCKVDKYGKERAA